MQVSILAKVDVLVVGAGTGAVAAALESRRAGRTVMLVSDLSYVGDDVAGTYNLWPSGIEKSDPLVASIFPSNGDGPVMPAAVKGTLEISLAKAGVRLLYLSRPVALLRGSGGAVNGAILAARTSLYAVSCNAIVDASRFGVVARLAGATFAARENLPAKCYWNILCDGLPQGLTQEYHEIRPQIRRKVKDEEKDFSAFRVAFSYETFGKDVRAAEHHIRAAVLMTNLLGVADIIQGVPPERIAGPLAASVQAVSDAQLQIAPGVFVASQMLPLNGTTAATLERCDVQVALGRRVGAIAAKAGTQTTTSWQVMTGGTINGDYRFAEAFLRKAEGTVEVPSLAWPKLGQFDVVVAGGGTGGAPAGIGAARGGAKTLLLEVQHALGGVGTLGLITKYWFGNRVGFTEELRQVIGKIDPSAESQKGTGWSPEIKAAVYQRLLLEAGGMAWLGSFTFGVRMNGNRINGVLVTTPNGCGLIETSAVVDATGNADIAAAAGAPCRVIDGRHVATQGTGLSPRLWPGVRYQNSDHTFVDETDPEGVTLALVNSRAKFPTEFDVAPLINTRERRQILGEYEISPLDIMAGRTFPDTMFTATSNFDTHGFIVHPLFMMVPPDHAAVSAHVPYRCMLPQKIEGVLVTGLGMSAHRDALPVIRMQADVQNQGFGAGLAAANVAKQGGGFRELNVKALQRELAKVGILAAEVPAHTDSFPLPISAIDAALQGDLGLVMNAAILIAHPQQSQPRLLQIMKNDADAKRRVDAALLLGLMGIADAGATLADAVAAATWDDGWNYRGMGQFGASMSRLDAMIIALARTGAAAGVRVIKQKIEQLDSNAQFSHCRAVALATAMLKSRELVEAISHLLNKPTMQGHVQLTVLDMVARANDDECETEARNLSLRELYLARGLFVAGDKDGLGRSILERYTSDVRGHYARHARAVLENPQGYGALELA